MVRNSNETKTPELSFVLGHVDLCSAGTASLPAELSSSARHRDFLLHLDTSLDLWAE